MFCGVEEVPRLPSRPRLASGMRWQEIQIEQHQLTARDELAGVIRDFQICLNLGEPTVVRWRTGGTCTERLVKTGQLSIASHGHERRVQWDARMDVLLISLSTKLFREMSEDVGRGRSLELTEHYGIDEPQIRTMALMLHADLRSGFPAGALYGEQLGAALAAYLSTRFGAEPVKSCRKNVLPRTVLQRVFEYMEARLDQTLTLCELAGVANMSQFHFAHLFRNSVGTSPAHYLTGQRIAKARQLLMNPEITLGDVAVRTGFSSQSHLTAVFRKTVGVTPGRYRGMF